MHLSRPISSTKRDPISSIFGLPSLAHAYLSTYISACILLSSFILNCQVLAPSMTSRLKLTTGPLIKNWPLFGLHRSCLFSWCKCCSSSISDADMSRPMQIASKSVVKRTLTVRFSSIFRLRRPCRRILYLPS